MLTLLTRCPIGFNAVSRSLARCVSLIIITAAVMLLIGLTAAPVTSHAAQSYDNCTGFITSLPATISTQGTWCLNADLATAITSGTAITVATNNVTIDCNDFRLGGLAAGLGTQANGIRANNRDNLTIRRCNIRGFFYGVWSDGGSGHLIEDSRFDGNTYVGIFVDANASIIRRNIVRATGESSVQIDLFGIFAENSVDVLDNTINGVKARANGLSAYGIRTFNNANGSISGNRIRNVTRGQFGFSYGIYNASSGRILLRNNDVVGDTSGGSIGLRCENSFSSAHNNMVSGFATAFATCRDDGNVVIP